MALVERGPAMQWPLTTQAQLLSLNRSSLYYRPVVPSGEGLARYLDFHNQERPHQALDYRTPAEVCRRAEG